MNHRNSGYRLTDGGLVDRSQMLDFSFNGVAMKGYAGDTLASALLANGVNIVARSFKYRRPRGFFGVGAEDPNSAVAVQDGYSYEPALRAGQVWLAQGMKVRSVGGWPRVEFDLGAVTQLFSGMLGAGFYYKTFKWPFWALFEPFIRKATGYGAPAKATNDRTVQQRHAVCDVLIIGAGPAGLAAATALRGSGLKVVVADDQKEPGGSCRWESARFDGVPAAEWSRHIATQVAADADCTLLAGTTVTGAYENEMFTLVQTIMDEQGVRGERIWKLMARYVVLASGMVDRPLMFEGNDRPGVMLSSAVRRFIGEFGVSPARRLAVYTNNDSAYLTALQAKAAGVDVVAIVDTRPANSAIYLNEARAVGITCYCESQIESTRGYRRLEAIALRQAATPNIVWIFCDGVAVSGGWTPAIQLAAHRGVKPEYDVERSMFLCKDLPAGWFAVGGANGALDLQVALDQAHAAAHAIAEATVTTLNGQRFIASARGFGAIRAFWLPTHGASHRMWVDLQNDVKVSDISLAVQENYVSVEHLKRYTTLGMGTDQGRTSNVNGLALLAALSGCAISAVGTTSFRPPYTATSMRSIAGARSGDLYRPRRYLPAHAVHIALGAVVLDFGWERPDWYRSNGDDREAAVRAEMASVRNGVGVFDASSLGKIEVTGPDAAAFLARFYVSNIATLKPGRVRYSVMLREDGVIFDDGVVTCVAENHYLASPTSGNAEVVAAWFERWRQTEWPQSRVAIAQVTSNWASIAIAGPKARELLMRLEPGFDASGKAFAHMEFREGPVAGIPARVARISFTGELQFEISVPARYAGALMQSLLAETALTPLPIGMEAWLRLRLEKGYIHLGSDTNGRTTPLDLGMGDIVSKRKDDFIGKRSLELSFAVDVRREQLVGLIATRGVLETGGRILAKAHVRPPCPTEGYVTSACESPSLQRSIGLALLEQGHQRTGEKVRVLCGKNLIECLVCEPTFYDPKNERLHA